MKETKMATIAELEARAEILARRNSELEQKLATSERRADQLEVRSMQSESAAERATIESHLRMAAYVAGSTKGPVEDAVRNAMREATWKLDSKGKLLRVLPDGQWDMTEQGDYVSASAWMRQYAKTMPSYFPNAQPSGSPDDSAAVPIASTPESAPIASTSTSGTPAGRTSNAPNPWSAADWNVTLQSQCILKEGKAAAEALAKAAGTALNATGPAKPAATIVATMPATQSKGVS